MTIEQLDMEIAKIIDPVQSVDPGYDYSADMHNKLIAVCRSFAISELEKAKEIARMRNEQKDSRGFRSMMDYIDQAVSRLREGGNHE